LIQLRNNSSRPFPVLSSRFQVISVSLFLVLLFSLVYSQTQPDTIKKPVKKHDKYFKSSSLATLLSAAIPGGGQFYTENYWKGILIAGTEGALAYFAIKDHLSYEDTHNIRYQNRRNNLFWWLATVKVLSMADAYVSANMYKFKDQMKLSVNYNIKEDKITVGVLTKTYIW
jgi:hypothetical protein